TQPPGGQSQVAAPWVRGMNPQLETNLSALPSSIIEGKFDVSDSGVLVGSELAHNLSLRIGDIVLIHSPKDYRKWRETQGKEHEKIAAGSEYEVRGIFDVGYYEYNLNFMVTSLADAQDLYDLSNSVHGLTVMLSDPYAAPTVAKGLARTLGPE